MRITRIVRIVRIVRIIRCSSMLFLESVDCGLGTGTDRCVEVTLVQDRSWPDYGKVYYDNLHTLVSVAGAET